MKKALLYLLMLMLTLSLLVSCGKKNKGNKDDDGDGAGDQTTDQTPETPDGGTTETPGTGDGGTTETPETPDTGDTPGTDTPSTDSPTGTVVFSSSVIPVLITDNETLSDQDKYHVMNSIANEIGSKISEAVIMYSDSLTPSANEIVIGQTNREITAEALTLLQRRLKNEARKDPDVEEAEKDLVGYAIYAKGGSLAVVWSDYHIEDAAIEYFVTNYVSSENIPAKELTLKEGYIKTVVFSLEEYLTERGNQIKSDSWRALEDFLPDEYSTGIVRALQSLYALFTEENYIWLANLYDPEVGGMYWSDSARDNVGFLPDLEDTYELYGYVAATGMAEWYGGDAYKALPYWLHDQIYEFFRSLQDEDGYFYHPQWPKEFIMANGLQSRITRDHGSAKTVFRNLYNLDSERYPGPKYPYEGVQKSESALTASIHRSAATAVSTAVAVAAEREFLWQYKSPEAFDEYLAELDIEIAGYTNPDSRAGRFYYYGNLFQSTTSYINSFTYPGKVASDPECREAQKHMRSALENFFNKYQNPENGMWGTEICYNMTNGIHKIGSVYNSLGLELQYVDEMVDTVIEICSWEQYDANGNIAYTSSSTDIYNAWSCFPYIYQNLRKFGNDAKAEEIINRVCKLAPDMIQVAYRHIVGLRDENGAFFYSRSGQNSTAQGCPISVSGVSEANVNGNGIAMIALTQHILGALEADDYFVPIYTEVDRLKFVEILENLQAVVKNTDELGVETFYDFEDVAIGEVPTDFEVTLDSGRGQILGSYIRVEEIDGNRKIVLHPQAKQSDNERNYALIMPVQNLSIESTATVVEFDLWVDPASKKDRLIEMNFRSANGGAAVILPSIKHRDGGILDIHETVYNGTGDDFICTIGKAGETIKLRIEYFWGEGVYKIYVNGTFRGSGTRTYNTSHKKVGSVAMGSASSIYGTYTIDNVKLSNVKKQYVDGAREYTAEKLYDFAVAELPSDFIMNSGNGAYAVEGGQLKVTNSPDGTSPVFTVPTNIRSFIANGGVVRMDVTPTSNMTAGKMTDITLHNENGAKLFSVGLGVNEDGYYYLDGGASFKKTVTNIKYVKNKSLGIRIEYYLGLGDSKSDLGLCVYLDGETEPTVVSVNPLVIKYVTPSLAYATIGVSGSSPINVAYDNIAVENVPIQTEFPFPEIPEVTPGADKGVLDFEDFNVGELIHDRITGDAEIGAELNGSNRFLQIKDDGDLSKEVTITPYGEKEGASHIIFDMDVEYLISELGELLKLYVVDDKGKETLLFTLKEVSYASGTQIRMFNTLNQVMDSSPNILSRKDYRHGLGYPNNGPTSTTTIRVVVDLAAGTVTATYRGSYSVTQKLASTDVAGIKLVSGMGTSSILTLDNVEAQYVDENAVYDPTIENFEGEYTENPITWECTNSASDSAGKISTVVDLIFKSGTEITFSTSGNTNQHGATASVITEGNNSYVNMTAPKRAVSRDRAHGITLKPQICSLSAYTYVFDVDLKVDSFLPDGSESHKSFIQLIIYSTNGRYIQYSSSVNKDGQITIGGVTIANWDEWASLRFEFHPERNEIQVFSKDKTGVYVYRGSLGTPTGATSVNNTPIGIDGLEGSIATLSLGGANNEKNGFSMNIDNVALYYTKKDYVEGQTPVALPLPVIPEYELTFKADDGEVAKETVKANAALTLPTAPEKDGYTFVGWFFENGTELTATSLTKNPLKGNATVYARYEKIPEYTIRFMANGALIDSITVRANALLTLPTLEDSDGLYFDGWVLENGQKLTADYLTKNPLTGDIEVNAKFARDYKITFVVDGIEYYSMVVRENAIVTLPEEPYKDAHYFDGWFFEDGGKLSANTLVNNPLTGDVTVTAQFTPIVPEIPGPDADDFVDVEEPSYGEDDRVDNGDAPADGDLDGWL